jgi:preprotein translocase subunit SecE
MDSIISYIRESYNELVYKVTWPSRENLLSTTMLVIVSMAIMALILLLLDVVAAQVLGLVYKFISGLK